jgi:ATP-dependent exoDNAse (exonuclease V) alpha subunit
MAMFRIDIKPIKRSANQRATAAAAYRAGERIRDERTGAVHNHSRRKDVTHTEIFLPSRFGESPMEWARDRARLWNAAEAAEKRSNSRVAREFEVALPSELSATQRLALARSFARELSDRYGTAVDLAVHDPKAGGDPRHFHAHLLTTTREVTPTGLGAKAGLDMGALERAKQGLPDGREQYTAVRERWAALMNQALRDANIEARVDHRTLAAQGIDRQPMVHVPMEFYRGKVEELDPGVRARLREDYRARVAAHVERSNQRAPTEQPRSLDEKVTDRRSVEEIRRDAVQSWLRMRSKEAESSVEKGAGSEREQRQLGEQPSPGDRTSHERSPEEMDRARDTERDSDRGGRVAGHDQSPDSAAAASSDLEDDAGM